LLLFNKEPRRFDIWIQRFGRYIQYLEHRSTSKVWI